MRTYCPETGSRYTFFMPSKLGATALGLLTVGILHAESTSPTLSEMIKSLQKTYIIGPIGDYELHVRELEDPNVSPLDRYLVYQNVKQKKVLLVDLQSNAFSALMSIPDKSIRRKLALAYMNKLIELYGRDEIQTTVSEQRQLLPLQKEAYLDAGLELPEKYFLLDP